MAKERLNIVAKKCWSELIEELKGWVVDGSSEERVSKAIL
jgi:hypothetical protein